MEYDMEPDIRSITKAKALDEVDAWLNDKDDTYGWSYGDDDVSIGIYYDDGTYVSKDDLNGKKFKKKGVRGISISTGDYEIVWGEAYYRKSKEWWPLQTWSEDGESGMSNVYSGYRTSKQRHVRVKETYVYDEKTKRHTRKREKIRVSTWKEV